MTASSSLLEFDAVDHAHVRLLVRVKAGKQAYVRILDVGLSGAFPEAPPSLLVSDLATGKQWKLDEARFRYSPRWDTHRMAEELFNHACRCIPGLTRGATGPP